ncbi:hypothetical protein M6G63_10055 [Pseudomonas sp. BYT-5]|uniref:hypothetical protein n=1 Tax=unclassified Pseudomonas TaxID=196821 RepID=UPI00201FF3DF|nr:MULTISPECIES: hypothetical protein [unclassified Pseudomonas]URD44561.1 hypothetical protein M6G63_10055 [Pseudomonas sp. BYT-5]URK99887.1 hypothetical protein J5X93_10025 [Pseudomonas sp. BYT-1]
MQSNSKPFIVVDGVTYINEAMVREATMSVRLSSKASDEVGRPLVELDLSSGSITLRSRAEGSEQGIAGQVIVDAARGTVKLSRDERGRYFAAGVELGVDEVLHKLNISIAETHLAADLAEKIKEAVTTGIRSGYQAVLKDLGKGA